MMFTLLQEQNKAQLKLMAAANKQAMDAMFERMNALIMGHGKAADKVPATIPDSSTTHSALQTAIRRDAQTAESSSFTSRKLPTSSRPMEASVTQD